MASLPHHLQNRLHESQQRLALALRAGGMAAWEWTGTDDVWTDDLYDLLGVPRTEKASTALFFSRVHPEDLVTLQQDWQRAVAGECSYESEFRIVRPDGAVRWLRGVGDLVRDAAGEVIRIYGLNWDITREKELEAEREQLRQRAEAAGAAKSEFLATMSHEIRTPLTAILAYATLLRRHERDSTRLDYVRRIERNGQSLLDIVNDILDMSQIEAGRIEPEWGPVDVERLLRDVHSTMEVRAAQQGLALSVEIDDRITNPIRSDAKRLRQILINLVGNALKFTEQGWVKVVCRPGRGISELEFQVVDTGPGIAPEQLDRLFEPFVQVEQSATRSYEGTGLGLTIARRFAVLLGGDLTVESRVGRGSTFTCTIDAGADRTATASPVHDPGSDRGPVANASPALAARVLVVDHLQDNATWIATVLRESGAQVEVADDGATALALVRERPPFDLAILDVQETGVEETDLDGFGIARRLREIGQEMPLIALAAEAHASHDLRHRARQEGFGRLLTKPAHPRALLAAVRDALAGRG